MLSKEYIRSVMPSRYSNRAAVELAIDFVRYDGYSIYRASSYAALHYPNASFGVVHLIVSRLEGKR